MVVYPSLLLWVALSWFVPMGAAAQEAHKMIVPFSPIGGSTVPFWIATDDRLFQKYGLEVTPLLVGGSSAIVQSMAAKQVDIGLIGGGGVVLNRFAAGDLITIGAHGGILTSDCYAKPEIKSVAELKGKTIAVTRFGTTTHFFALAMLRLANNGPTMSRSSKPAASPSRWQRCSAGKSNAQFLVIRAISMRYRQVSSSSPPWVRANMACSPMSRRYP